MEYIKVIKHTNGDDKCLKNVVNYPIGKDQVLKEGFGINPNDSKEAMRQFQSVAKFWDNQDKTPVFHYMTAFTGETAPTAEKAMELTKEIFKDITDSHLAATGTHYKDREWNWYHNHTAVSPTNINDGSMLYADNSTNFALAQNMADVTGQPTKLIIRKEDGTEVEIPKVFVPHDYED
ncbi:relaxase/mobilization nuclease domain-containing protein [Ruminococcus flavefaciens]|uniref:relaxase/mobilization nuclease domain-containing protein n=1 Tax=Ruminococcus flavefaciens TaxID=1265 RepID=UPI0004666FE6|nr:relaxase/mobilization nuclease domain-containing protein [Ruminococcus flavefaciens]